MPETKGVCRAFVYCSFEGTTRAAGSTDQRRHAAPRSLDAAGAPKVHYLKNFLQMPNLFVERVNNSVTWMHRDRVRVGHTLNWNWNGNESAPALARAAAGSCS